MNMGSPSNNFQKRCVTAVVAKITLPQFCSFCSIATMIFWRKLHLPQYILKGSVVFKSLLAMDSCGKTAFKQNRTPSYAMLIVLTLEELVLVWTMKRFLPPHQTCRAHTRPPERKSGGRCLLRTQHFPLLPPSLQFSSFSSFPLNVGHRSVGKK